jgi:hypothetical protein
MSQCNKPPAGPLASGRERLRPLASKRESESEALPRPGYHVT